MDTTKTYGQKSGFIITFFEVLNIEPNKNPTEEHKKCYNLIEEMVSFMTTDGQYDLFSYIAKTWEIDDKTDEINSHFFN